MIRTLAGFVAGTKLHAPLERVLNVVRNVSEPTLGKFAEWYLISRHGKFTPVSPRGVAFPPFDLRLEGGNRLQRRRARGVYEPHVMDFLAETIDEETVFWEVGAGWGYFSNAVASIADTVIAFEMRNERAIMIETSAIRNGHDNIHVVPGRIDRGVDVSRHPLPNVCLVDIEGWEFVFLNSFLSDHSASTTWIVEVHDEVVDCPTGDSVRAIRGLFEDHGYVTELLNPYTSHNPHVVARPRCL